MYSPSNDDLSARVRRTLEDLAVIRQTLLAEHEPSLDSASLPSQALDLELASELKSVVDALRRLLWAYMQALSAKSGRPPDEILNWYKMELAVEMLRSVRTRTQDVIAAEESTQAGYFEQLVNNALAVTSQHGAEETHI